MNILKGEENLLTYRDKDGHKKPAGNHGERLPCGSSDLSCRKRYDEEMLRKEWMHCVGGVGEGVEQCETAQNVKKLLAA